MSSHNFDKIPYIKGPDYTEYGSLASRDKLLWILRKMLEMRIFEEKVEELFLVEGSLIGPSHLYLGEEAIATGVAAALRDDDPFVTTYRCHGHALAKGVRMDMLMAELFGKETGTCKGLGGSMHAAICLERNVIYATAIVGSGIPIAAGAALAVKMKNEDKVVTTFFGDGATNTGAFHEAMNIISLWKLPVLLVCENNLYGMGTHLTRAFAGENIAARTSCYGIKSYMVDGNDVMAVYKATLEASKHIRRERVPVFLECRTYRMKGHGVYDKAEYRPKEEVEVWLKRDPIEMFYKNLLKAGLINEEDFKRMNTEVRLEVNRAVEFAKGSRVLDFSKLYEFVYV